MNYEDLVTETTTATDLAIINLLGAFHDDRPFSSAWTVGATGIEVMVQGEGGKFEAGIYTLTSASVLTRTSIMRSSNGGQAETFGPGTKYVRATLTAGGLMKLARVDSALITAIANQATTTIMMEEGGVPKRSSVDNFVAAVGIHADALPVAPSISGGDYLLGVFDGVEKRVLASVVQAFMGVVADTTAPTLTSPTGAQTGTTTATGTVTTNDATGTLYFLASTSATATAAAVKAGSTQAITSTGSKSVAVTGLIASTLYYLHYLHRDSAGNDSTVSTSASFTTAAAGDTTAPVISAPLGTQTGSSTASGGATTNEANGTLYCLASINATETAATIKAANLTTTVSATGAIAVSFTGLPASTTLYAHYVHRDAAGNDSNVVASASFTTAAASNSHTITPYTVGNVFEASLSRSLATAFTTQRSFAAGLAMEANGTYWNISPTSAVGARCGWSLSNVSPPADTVGTSNNVGDSSTNGMRPMTRPSTWHIDECLLWVPINTDSGPWYFWMKPIDGNAQVLNPAGLMVVA